MKLTSCRGLRFLPLISEPYVPYVISVSASTRAGVGEAKDIIAFTKERGIEYTPVMCVTWEQELIRMYVASLPLQSTGALFLMDVYTSLL